MKPYLISLLTIICLLSFGCKNDENFDNGYDAYTPPRCFEFIITDKDGNNYLDRADRMEVIKKLLTIDYKGHTSVLKAIGEPSKIIGKGPIYEKSLRVYPEIIDIDPENLLFGDFSPYDNYVGDEFTINWCDGTKDLVQFDICYNSKKKEIRTKFLINGKETNERSQGFGGAVIRKTIDEAYIK